jgi:hypothetical protein
MPSIWAAAGAGIAGIAVRTASAASQRRARGLHPWNRNESLVIEWPLKESVRSFGSVISFREDGATALWTRPARMYVRSREKF